MFVYEGHLGSLYTSDYEEDLDDLYCDECGDYDWLVGEFKTAKDFLASYANEIYTEKNSGGWSLDYVFESVLRYFDDQLTEEEALKIVLENQNEDKELEYIE